MGRPKQRRVSLVATDLDETLWDHSVIMAETITALDTLANNNIPVLAATARRPGSALAVMRANNILLPTVLFNGSLGLDFTDDSVFHARYFEPPVAKEVLDVLSMVGIEPCVNVHHATHDVVVGESPSTHPGHLAFLEPWLRSDDLYEVAKSEPVLSIGVCGREQDLMLRAQGAIGKLGEVTVSRDPDYGGYTLSVRPGGVTKWSGVVAYCQRHGINPDEVLAVGDGQNDIELLSAAAVSCASRGACDEVLAIADYRLGDSPQGGWHSIVDLILSP